jgi:hypothetical protein
MRALHGPAGWSFLPRTFLLPGERHQLDAAMGRAGPDGLWIVKPPDLSCGRGISLARRLAEVPERRGQLCVQHYLATPLLIHGLKFDLRVYVLLTSVEPLRIYLYREGLARSAGRA